MFFRTAQAEPCQRHATCHKPRQPFARPATRTWLKWQTLRHLFASSSSPPGRGREGVISRLPQVQFAQGLFQLGEPKSSPNCIRNFDSILVTFLVSRKLRWSRARFVWLADNATVICCHFQRYFYCETNRQHLARLQWGLPNPQGERENTAEYQTDSMNRRWWLVQLELRCPAPQIPHAEGERESAQEREACTKMIYAHCVCCHRLSSPFPIPARITHG